MSTAGSRTFLFATLASFALIAFPARYFGKLLAMAYFIGGVGGLIYAAVQSLLLSVTDQYKTGGWDGYLDDSHTRTTFVDNQFCTSGSNSLIYSVLSQQFHSRASCYRLLQSSNAVFPRLDIRIVRS